jgi:hypothetical protein
MAPSITTKEGTSSGKPARGRRAKCPKFQFDGQLKGTRSRSRCSMHRAFSSLPESETSSVQSPDRPDRDFLAPGPLAFPATGRVESAPTERERHQLMNTRIPPFGEAPSEGTDMQDLLRRLTTIEHNQRDILFLLRSLRLALNNVRVELSPETRRIHREIIRMEPFNGHCPCCLQTKVVSDQGALIPPVEFDHFFGSVYNAPVHSWLICRPCHQGLSNDRHLTWYHQLSTQFRRYQAAAEAYTTAFGRRTPARIYAAKSGQ